MTRIALTLAATLFGTAVAVAQAPATAPTTIPAPMAPVLVQYHFWPEQFMQWIGTELSYSMLELDVDDNKGKPIYDVVLTDRATKRRIHYSNMQAIVDGAKRLEEEAYKTEIAFERPDAATTGAAYTLHLALHDGKPLEWRFIQGSDVMEQGGGLTPLAAAPMPVFLYREEAAVAGEGTALQIGDTASAAEMWKEISKPPYFVAWHGAYSTNTTSLILSGGEEKWTVTAAPATLTKDAAWKLAAADGREETIHIDKLDGAHATLSIDTGSPNKRTVDATYDGTQWHIERLRFIPRAGEAHAAVLQFAPALSQDGSSSLEILIAKKRIANAAVTAKDAAGTASLAIEFKSPEWAKSKAVVEVSTITSGTVSLAAKPR